MCVFRLYMHKAYLKRTRKKWTIPLASVEGAWEVGPEMGRTVT